ncbi:MAG: glycosyltransferase [Candidatus Curtissbacteria bacterium]
MKVCLVHDDFVQEGGAENLFAEIARIYKDTPIYTSVVDWSKLPKSIDKSRVHTSFMQKIPFAAKFYKLLLPLYPLAFESFDLSSFDLVISSTTRFAKGVVTSTKTTHVCYINSVPRFLWHESQKESYLPSQINFFIQPFLKLLKNWDKTASVRVDFYIANSKNVASHVKKAYAKDASVVYPFADTDFFQPAKIHNWKLKNQNYYLVVSRLVRWKRIELAIEAAQNLGINLKIVGVGPDSARLKIIAPSENIEFMGNVAVEKLRQLYQNARGLIVTQDEDFGIAMVEAQACGIPVIAFRAGGQKEIVKDGETGLFFNEQTPMSLEDAISKSIEVKWNLKQIVINAKRFSKAQFGKNLKALVKEYATK